MANNPYVNKVVYGNSTLIDLTADTATQADVAQGKYFHLPTGQRVQGTASGGGGSITQDANGYLVLSPDGGGGGASVPWFGIGNAELVHTSNYEVKLSDTNWASLTPSTSQQTVTLPATDYSVAGTTVVFDKYTPSTPIDLTTNGLVIIVDAIGDMKYLTNESEMTVGHVLTTSSSCVYYYGLAANETAGVGNLSNTANSNFYTNIFNARSSAGNMTGSAGIYGLCFLGYSPSPSLSASGSTINRISYNASAYIRSSTSYMETSAWSNLDASNTKLKVRMKTYLVDYPGLRTGINARAVDLLNNGAFPTD